MQYAVYDGKNTIHSNFPERSYPNAKIAAVNSYQLKQLQGRKLIMAKELSNQAKWKPWKGVVLFVIAFFVVVAGSVATLFIGTYGTLITQFALLGIAVAACLINKTPLKEVFPLKKITLRDFFGTVLMWIGIVPLGFISSLAIGSLMPDIFAGVASDVHNIATGVAILGFVATVICPPVCEEAVMRGAILSNFRGVKKDWVIILVVAVMFGLLHMDPVRLINTSLLGACMAYIMVKRNNIILPAMFHLLNNFVFVGISSILSLFSGFELDQTVQSAELTESVNEMVNQIPLYMIAAFLCPMILAIGAHLIKRQKEISEGEEKSGMKLGAKIGLSVIPCIMLLGGGLLLTACSVK